MLTNINFRRFDKSANVDGFIYKPTTKPDELDYTFSSVSMDKAGFCLHYNVQNYMAEAVLLGGNLRVNPTKIHSLRRDDVRPRDDYNNYVIITICSSENKTSPDPRKRTTHNRKVDIRIPGKMLNQGSVFISELDCYLMTESQIDATRELIARDVQNHGWESISIPASMVQQDPAKLYIEFKELSQFCIERQDKINIRIGVDIRYGEIPEIIKTMRISILDSYFIPYSVYKLVYDPTLNEDEFVIENLHLASRDEFRATFSELNKVGSVYLDYDEIETMFGKFYGMAIFANESVYLNYVHKRKTQERFNEETLFVAHRSGDPRLKEHIARLEKDCSSQKETIEDQANQIVEHLALIKRQKAELRSRDEVIEKIRTRSEEKIDANVILTDLENDRLRIENDRRKIAHEGLDLNLREKLAPMAHRAVVWKNVADVLKSGWGITTACIGGVASIAMLCKKHNIRIVMGA